MKTKMIPTIALSVGLLLIGGAPALAQTQGVSKNEILLGTIQDLSGPLAGISKAALNGMMLRIDEINNAGGINGRKIKLAVEDSGYDPKRAVLAAQKLVNQDEVFAMVGHVGTAHNLAAMPLQFEKNVANLFPITGSREMYEPLHKLKYSIMVPYFEQLRTTLPSLVKAKNAKKVCAIYQDDDYGAEIRAGAEAGLKALNMELVEKTSFKRGSTDFSSQVAKVKAADCDLVVLGTVIRETIGTIGEARRIGYNPTFLGTVGLYNDVINRLGGKTVDGLYATMWYQIPYADDPSAEIRAWVGKYKAKYSDDPTESTVVGYNMIEIFSRAATKAGANLTAESLVAAMDTLTIPPTIFGDPEFTFTPTKHLSHSLSRLSQVQDGRWKVISEYPKP